MAAYLIALIDVTDAEAYKEYAARTPVALEKYKGRFLARGGRSETLEGPDAPSRVVVIEFPDYETAVAQYQSPEYQDAKSYRDGAATGQFIVVDGA